MITEFNAGAVGGKLVAARNFSVSLGYILALDVTTDNSRMFISRAYEDDLVRQAILRYVS